MHSKGKTNIELGENAFFQTEIITNFFVLATLTNIFLLTKKITCKRTSYLYRSKVFRSIYGRLKNRAISIIFPQNYSWRNQLTGLPNKAGHTSSLLSFPAPRVFYRRWTRIWMPCKSYCSKSLTSPGASRLFSHANCTRNICRRTANVCID